MAGTDGGLLLEVEDLSVDVRSPHGWVRVLDRVNLVVEPRQTVGLVGESGSGKTLTSLAIMGLLDRTSCRVVNGSIRLEGRELVGLSDDALSSLRGRSMAMIFQEPRRSLHPSFSVGSQIAQVVRRHRGASRAEAWARAVEILDRVGIRDAARRAHKFPHEFSGGMCQRVMLGIALAGDPKLLIADEPTTALDVTVQDQVLCLMKQLQEDFGLSILLITHDLGVVAEMCDVVAIMYAGQVVEVETLYDAFERPQHPYTAGLLAAIPTFGAASERLRAIPGVVPQPWELPGGCRFNPRCAWAIDGVCTTEPVMLTRTGRGLVRCARSREVTLEGSRD